MGRIDEEGLKKQIKAGAPDRLYLLYGGEDYLKQHYASFIPKKLIEKDFEAFNLHMLDGKSVTLDEIADCVTALPMMGEYTCTVVHDMNLAELLPNKEAAHGKNGVQPELETESELESEPESEAKSEGGRFEAFVGLISDIPESAVLIFWMDAISVDDKKGKWVKVVKTFEKYGSAVKLDRLSPGALAKTLCTGAAKRGCTLDKNEAFYMINLVGDDLGTLRNELEKLCLFKKSGVITRADIDSTVIVSAQSKIFWLARQIVDKKADEALLNLDALLKQREEPIKLLAVLSGAFVDMLRVKAAAQSGKKYDAVAESYPGYKKKMFLLENAASSARKYSLEQLRSAILLLSKADTDLKSSRVDGRIILETLIINLLRI